MTELAGKENLEYAPLFESTKKLGGNVIALNLSREVKQVVVKEGLDSIDPLLVPDNYEIGGDALYERFEEALGGHAPADMVLKYFIAQSLVDSLMSYHAVKNEREINFIIAGSFHTDFNDATTIMLKKLTISPVTSLKIVNDSKLNEEELLEFTQGSPLYGQYADFIIVVR